MERSLPWVKQRAAEFVRRFPKLAPFQDDLVQAFVLRWLEQGWPPLFEWVAVDLQRKELGIYREGKGSLRGQWLLAYTGTPTSYRPPLEAKVRAAGLLRRLPSAQAHVLDRYYGREWTLREIADDAGVTMQRVHQLRNQGLTAARGEP